jgi:hypothetical protein
MDTIEQQDLAPRLLKEGPARRYLGNMSHGAFFELRQDKTIPTYHVGRSVYFDRNDLDAFIATLREEALQQGDSNGI